MIDTIGPNESAIHNEEFFETRYIDLAGALVLTGFPLADICPDGETYHTRYRFADSPELREIVAMFHEDELLVSARAYGNRLYRLRARVRAYHDAQRQTVGVL